MCAPMSPSAPEPALSLSSRQVSGASRIGDPVLQVLRPHVPDVPIRPVGDHAPGQGDGRDPAVGEPDHRLHDPRAGRLGRRGHRLGLGDGVGQRLLAQHVLAGGERRDGDLGVGVAGGADVDEVDVVALDSAPPVGLDCSPSRAARPPLPRAARSRPPTTASPAAAAGRRNPAGGAPGLRVRGAHERVADHADPQGRLSAACHGQRFPTVEFDGSQSPRRVAQTWVAWSATRAAIGGQDSKRSRQVLVDVLLGDDRCVEHDRARHLDLDQVAHALALGDQPGEPDAVGGLRRRVDDRRLQHGRRPRCRASRCRAGAADHEELVAAGVVDRRHHADALVVVVVPDGVDLRRGLQQVRRRPPRRTRR